MSPEAHEHDMRVPGTSLASQYIAVYRIDQHSWYRDG